MDYLFSNTFRISMGGIFPFFDKIQGFTKRFLAIFTLKSAPIYSENYFLVTLWVNLSP